MEPRATIAMLARRRPLDVSFQSADQQVLHKRRRCRQLFYGPPVPATSVLSTILDRFPSPPITPFPDQKVHTIV